MKRIGKAFVSVHCAPCFGALRALFRCIGPACTLSLCCYTLLPYFECLTSFALALQNTHTHTHTHVQVSEEERGEEEDELQRLDATRLLTPEEFEKIRKLRAKRELEASLGKNAGPDAESLQVCVCVCVCVCLCV
jgi:hypothetical protein